MLEPQTATAGAIIGTAMLKQLGFEHAAYMWIFAASAVLRLLVLAAVRTVRSDVRHAAPMAMQTLALRPSAGSIDLAEPASLEDPLASDGRGEGRSR